MEKIVNNICQEFVKLKESVNSLLVTSIAVRLLSNENINVKFKLGFYNDFDQKISYKYSWFEYDNHIYDLANYINDEILNVVPRHRDNAYIYETQLYTIQPLFPRADMDTQLDKDYDEIIDYIYALIVSGDDEYFNEMPAEYLSILTATRQSHGSKAVKLAIKDS